MYSAISYKRDIYEHIHGRFSLTIGKSWENLDNNKLVKADGAVTRV